MARRAGLLICTAVLGGCGSEPASSRPAASATAAPAALVERARECGRPAPAEDVTVPGDLARLLPADSLVLANPEAGSGYRVSAFVDADLVTTLRALEQAAGANGYETTFSEREAIDAELVVRDPDGEVLSFRLDVPGGCGDSVALTASRIG